MKGVSGGLAGLLSYALLLPVRGPWRQVIAALLIGAACGWFAGRRFGAATGAVSAAAGWIAGTLLFGLWADVGLGAWTVCGLSLGLAFGIASRSPWRAVVGAVAGFLGGAIAEIARYAGVFFEPLRLTDVDLLVLVCAGLAFSGVTALAFHPRGSSHAA